MISRLSFCLCFVLGFNEPQFLNKCFVVLTLKLANKNSSLSFLSDTCQETNVKIQERNSIACLINHLRSALLDNQFNFFPLFQSLSPVEC